MVCDARSGVRWFLSMCGECDDTCVECDDTCGVRRSFSSALFFEYACLERPIETAKNSTSNPSPNLDRHISFFCILFHTMQNFTGQTILCTLSWNKVTYQNPGQEYDENLVCEDFLNMGMLPLEHYTPGLGVFETTSVCFFRWFIPSSLRILWIQSRWPAASWGKTGEVSTTLKRCEIKW